MPSGRVGDSSRPDKCAKRAVGCIKAQVQQRGEVHDRPDEQTGGKPGHLARVRTADPDDFETLPLRLKPTG